MAIAFGAATTGSNLGASDLTFSSPNISGSNTLLVLAVYGVRASAISTPTHNGDNMTLISTVQSVESNRRLGLYYILNPDTGTNNISISVTASGSPTNVLAAASYYTGVKQQAPEATDSSIATATSITDSVTTLSDNAWVIGCGAETGGTGAIAAGTGVTSRGVIGDGSNDSSVMLGDSNGPKTPAGSYSMTFTPGSSANLGIVMAAFAPAVDRRVFNIS
jgi:hypothetical protein